MRDLPKSPEARHHAQARTIVWRLTAVVACAATSVPGAFLSVATAVATFETGNDRFHAAVPLPTQIGPIVMLAAGFFAWVAWFRMAGGWIDRRKVPTWLAKAGTAAALVYFAPFAWVGVTSADSATEALRALSTVLLMILYGFAWVLPAVVLAIVMLRFHLSS